MCVTVLIQEGGGGEFTVVANCICPGRFTCPEGQTGHGDLEEGRKAEECGVKEGRRDAGGAKKAATPEAPHASRQAAQVAHTFECIFFLYVF